MEGKREYPNGWLMRAHRYLSYSRDEYHDAMKLFDDAHKEKTNTETQGMVFFTSQRDVVFGKYDRIQIEPIQDLTGFERKTNWVHDWLGSSQSILFYKWKDGDANRRFQAEKNSDETLRMVVSDAEQTDNHFISATFCYLSDKVRDYCRDLSYNHLLDQCEQCVLGLVEAFNQMLNSEIGADDKHLHSEVVAEVFGTMSAAEFVILWSAKQYSDIMYLVDCVRDFKLSGIDGDNHLLRTTDTLISFPDDVSSSSEEPKQRPMLKDIQGEACLQFATQEGAGEGTFRPFEDYFERCMENAKWFLAEEKADHPTKYTLRRSAGEYDLVTTIPSKYVTRLFCNPQLLLGNEWADQIKPLQEKYHDDIDAFCSSFHPEYNQYIRYSFTRLTYQKNKHLPSFVQNESWKEICRNLQTVSFSGTQKNPLLGERMTRIGSIKNDLCILKQLLESVQSSIPAVSNLNLELNQLFSDYTQCMCSSADGLWIDDYQQVFQEMLRQLYRLLEQIQLQDRNEEAELRQADTVLISDISELIKSIRRQTNHISTSGKLSFREQETHFGYTAQHDLVLHAYYGIVKRLIEIVYGYSDKNVQSVLYPIVDFQPGDHIQSDIYFEESAYSYAQETLKKDAIPSMLSPRIMTVHVPLDGMNNVMYYLPMMVHEVFHYAAPWDRTNRNRLLADIMVYLALESGLTNVFYSMSMDKLKTVLEKRKTKLTNSEQKSILGFMCQHFLAITRPVVKATVKEKRERIWEGIGGEFFAEEAKNLSDEQKNALRNGQILRSWFVKWLDNWLSDSACGEETDNSHGSSSEMRGVSGLFEPLFEKLRSELKKPENATSHITDVVQADFALKPEDMRNLYAEAVKEIQIQLGDALKYTGTVENNQALVQQYMSAVQDYLEDNAYQCTLNDLDELFPDVAMVGITQMSVAGYLLQIALDLDKKMVDCSEVAKGNIRLAAVLEWMINREIRKPVERQIKLEQHLELFKKLYCASYELTYMDIVGKEGNPDKERWRSDTVKNVDNWANAFRSLYFRFIQESNSEMMRWIRSLIEEQMLPCLMENGTENEPYSRLELFQKPYQEYVSLLETLWDNRDNEYDKKPVLKDLFNLSIGTILRFQHYFPLGQMNKEFVEKAPVKRSPARANDVVRFDSLPIYVGKLMNASDYFQVIQRAWRMLNQWREDENISSSCGMWYRGANDAGYAVLPSGFVHFAEDVGERCQLEEISKPKDISFLDIQRHRYESFRYAAEGSTPDVSPATYRSTLDYLTLMQHYNQRGNHHTNLMDWSEDFFAATYFALETQIDRNDVYSYQKRKDKAKEISNPPKDAVLYILDPIHFNRACQEIEKKSGLFDVPAMRLTGEVPNLSIPENQQRMEDYHNLYPGKGLGKPCDEPAKWMEIPPPPDAKEPVTLSDIKMYGCEQELKMHLPRAVFVAKLNNRIQAQNGMFIAYSLMSNPVVWAGRNNKVNGVNDAFFRYQSLESIQEFYLNQLGGHRSPFLQKIVIPGTMRSTLADEFHRFGLSRETVYPELDNNHGR